MGYYCVGNWWNGKTVGCSISETHQRNCELFAGFSFGNVVFNCGFFFWKSEVRVFHSCIWLLSMERVPKGLGANYQLLVCKSESSPSRGKIINKILRNRNYFVTFKIIIATGDVECPSIYFERVNAGAFLNILEHLFIFVKDSAKTKKVIYWSIGRW